MHFRGIPLDALDLAFSTGRIVTSSYIRKETGRTLAWKYSWDPVAVRQFMNGYVRNASDVYVTGHLTGVCRDPKDDQILECAPNAKAQILVTGDNDLFTLDPFRGLKIVKPRAYCEDTAKLRRT